MCTAAEYMSESLVDFMTFAAFKVISLSESHICVLNQDIDWLTVLI